MQGLENAESPLQLDGRTAAIHGTSTGGGRCASSVQQDTRPGAGCQELRATSGKVVAMIDGDCLRKQLDGSKHFLRKPPGIAFDDAILRAAELAGARSVQVRDRETGDVYTCQLSEFALHAVKVDRGFGLQYCLPFVFWRVRRAGAPVQMGLWG